MIRCFITYSASAFLFIVGCSSISNKIQVKLETPTTTSASTASTANTGTNHEFSNIKKFEPQIISETNKLLVLNGHCHAINKFSLSFNFTFDCTLKYLPIDFALLHHSGSEKMSTAYLNSLGNELETQQKTLSTCRKIRRYDIDKKYIIIIVNKAIKLVEIKDANSFIEWELLKNYEILTYLLFKLSIYDEEYDTIMYFHAFKNTIFYYIIAKFLIKLICQIYCIVQIVLTMMEQYQSENKISSKISLNSASIGDAETNRLKTRRRRT